MAVYWSILIGIPNLIATLTSSDAISDLIKQSIPPLIVGGFLLLNTLLAEISIYAIIIPYSFLLAVIFYLNCIYYPAKRRWTESIANGLPYGSHSLQLLDRMIMLLTYDGLIQMICRRNRRNIYFTHQASINKHNMNISLVHPLSND